MKRLVPICCQLWPWDAIGPRVNTLSDNRLGPSQPHDKATAEMENTTIQPVSAKEIIVVGAGVVGLSTAFALSRRGHAVTVFDPFPGRGASFVAAGLIAPMTEANHGEESLVALSVEAARRWPEHADEIESHTPYHVGLNESGTLLVALDSNDRARIRSMLPLYEALGLAAEWHGSGSVRVKEPLLAPTVRGGLEGPNDIQVDNRRLLSALTDVLKRAGVNIVRERVVSVRSSGTQATGVETTRQIYNAGSIILCAGYDIAGIEGLPVHDEINIRPVKGQILRLYQRDARLRLHYNVRALVAGSAIYIVPRSSGKVVVGATVEEQGVSFSTTAGAAYSLLRDAISVVPAIAEAEIEGFEVGLRPATRDNAPIIGPASLEGLVYALGGYRHGVLLSPLVADCIAELIDSGAMPEIAWPFSPERFRVHHG